MACLVVAIGCFACGLIYLLTGYEVPVGWVQIILGSLCTGLALYWVVTRRKQGRGSPPPRQKD